MRALISDVTGMIGARVAGRLAADGWTVIGLAEAGVDAPAGVDPMAWPRTSPALARAVSGVDALVCPDLAEAEVSPTAGERLTALVEAAIAAGVERIVLASTTELYEPTALESATVGARGPFVTPAAASPRARLAGRVVGPLRGAGGATAAVALRAPPVVGRDSAAGLALVRHVLDHGAAPLATSRFQPVDADELAAVLASAAAPAAAGYVLNVAGPEAIDRATLVDEIRRLFELFTDAGRPTSGCRPPTAPVPAMFATDDAARLLPRPPAKTVWVSLAEMVQEVVHRRRAEGRLPAVAPAIPAVTAAVEGRETPLRGQVAVVTGATAGIGRAAAVLLSRLGAHVVGVGRDRARGAALVAELDERPFCTPGAFKPADLTSSAEVRRLCTEIAAEYGEIAVLINNAGGVVAPAEPTAEGIDPNLALNLLAPVQMAAGLAGPLAAAGRARIVNVVCDRHRGAAIDPEVLDHPPPAEPAHAHDRAKFGLVMLTYCQAVRWDGTGVAIHAVHPGDARSNGSTAAAPPGAQGAARGAWMRTISVERAATHVVELAVSPRFEGASGLYVDRDEVTASAPGTYDEPLAWALWDRCTRWLGLAPPASSVSAPRSGDRTPATLR